MSDERPIQTFPDTYSIKAVGRDENDFVDFVLAIVQAVAGSAGPVTHYSRPSRKGSYLSVTVSFTAESQQQLDEVFSRVSAEERVVWVL